LSKAQAKRAVLAALGCEAELSGLAVLPGLSSHTGAEVLKWLDRSGLALPFLGRLRRSDAEKQLSEDWRRALSERLGRNVERTRDMQEEAQRLNAALQAFGVPAVALKGFTLSPDFCGEADFRHQVDLDFLVAANDVRKAAAALGSCGYSAARLNESGETCFLTPLRHIPSAHDDIYALQRQRQVDLHISIWEPCEWLTVEAPRDCLDYAQPQRIQGVEFLSLALEDKFLLHVLHAFRHSFRSWMRVAWLFEIAQCVETHRDDAALWKRVVKRAGEARLTKRVFAFVLGLVEQLFASRVPVSLRNWSEEAMSASLRTWLDCFAYDWAISDWPGSLSNLFLAAEFIPDARWRRQYWRSRLFPRKAQASLGPVAVTSTKKFFQWQAARLAYVARRAALHLKDIAALPVQWMRWRRSLGSSRGLILTTTGEGFVDKGELSYGNRAISRRGHCVRGRITETHVSPWGN
jgi:putative nucleotidyltransferase-like protein